MVVERLRGRTFFPNQLDGINWRLNLSMAQPSQAKMKLPNAQFEFGIKTGEVTVSCLDEALCVLPVICLSHSSLNRGNVIHEGWSSKPD